MWQINGDYFRKLAREHYGEFRYIGTDEFAIFLNMWANKNNCSVHGYGFMFSSEEDYIMFKLKGIATMASGK